MSSSVDDQKILGQQGPELSEFEKEESKAAADYGAVKNAPQARMQVKVYSPYRNYYNGPAFSLSAENATGPFDILPRHHNFVSLLSPCEMILRTVDEGEQKIRISGGLMHVKADEITVFLDV